MAKKQEKQTMSKEEQIGFHKGSLATLAKERQELSRLLTIVEQLMQMHISALKEQGVDLETAAKEAEKAAEEAKKAKVPIDEIVE